MIQTKDSKIIWQEKWLTEEQDPLWHLSAHKCMPHASGLEQVSPQVGTASVHGRLWVCFPHGQDRCPPKGHSPHEPLWQIFSHLWCPHEKFFPQTWKVKFSFQSRWDWSIGIGIQSESEWGVERIRFSSLIQSNFSFNLTIFQKWFLCLKQKPFFMTILDQLMFTYKEM